jgi:polysaccharide deacetylase family sporulation protein PdaB
LITIYQRLPPYSLFTITVGGCDLINSASCGDINFNIREGERLIRNLLVKILIITTILSLSIDPIVLSAPKKNRFYYEKRGEVVWEVPTEDKVIALTFDDGPDALNTAPILDLLEKYDAKATFFLVGNKVERNPELVKRELAQGHELANHTYSHSYLGNKTTADNMKKDILRAEKVIFSITGQKCRFFRPPGGYLNERLVNTAVEQGYIVVMWSWHQDSRDWSTPGVKKIVDSVLNRVQNGDIVLFHEYVEGKTQTIAALEQILPELKKRGYHCVTISELLTYRKTKEITENTK